jgi:hypothetical protein
MQQTEDTSWSRRRGARERTLTKRCLECNDLYEVRVSNDRHRGKPTGFCSRSCSNWHKVKQRIHPSTFGDQLRRAAVEAAERDGLGYKGGVGSLPALAAIVGMHPAALRPVMYRGLTRKLSASTVDRLQMAVSDLLGEELDWSGQTLEEWRDGLPHLATKSARRRGLRTKLKTWLAEALERKGVPKERRPGLIRRFGDLMRRVDSARNAEERRRARRAVQRFLKPYRGKVRPRVSAGRRAWFEDPARRDRQREITMASDLSEKGRIYDSLLTHRIPTAYEIRRRAVAKHGRPWTEGDRLAFIGEMAQKANVSAGFVLAVLDRHENVARRGPEPNLHVIAAILAHRRFAPARKPSIEWSAAAQLAARIEKRALQMEAASAKRPVEDITQEYILQLRDWFKDSMAAFNTVWADYQRSRKGSQAETRALSAF